MRVRERLRALEGLVAPHGIGGGSLQVVVAAASTALEDALSIVTDPREAQRVACRYCAYRVMRDATLCLSCWRKLDPVSANGQT